MSSIETLRLKLTYSPSLYDRLTLRYDERNGRAMPWLSTPGIFLDDARRAAKPVAAHNFARRDQAKWLYYEVFEGDCPTHGRGLHHTQSGKCVACRRSRVSDGPRSDARGRGEPTYAGECIVHGGVPHSTERGLCLACFNTLGQPRPVSTNPLGVYADRSGDVRPSPGG